jgi:hypothetical protein
MGNYKNNYSVKITYDSEVHLYTGEVYHKKLFDPPKVFIDNKQENVDNKLSSHMEYLDNKYINIYNKLRKDIREELYKKAVVEGVDWVKLKKERQITWQRESEIILYDNYGKPTFYLDVEGSKCTTAPNKIFLVGNIFFKSKEKNELKKNYEISLERCELFKDEVNKWEDGYHKCIDTIASDYNSKKKYAVELYYKIFLKNIKFTINERIDIDKNILNFNIEKSSLNFNVENKILEINHTLANQDKIKNILYDKKVESSGVYKYTITKSEFRNRLDQVFNNIIFTFISTVFKNDKESNMIDIIHFIGNSSHKNQSNIELIIDKKQYLNGRPYQFHLYDFISKFNRNQVLFQYLEREGINTSISSSDGHEIIISETKIDEKIINILAQFNELESLSLIDNDLNEIPTALYSFSHLKELYIHSNHIKSIPDDIEKLNSLEVLSLENNNISKLSNYIFKLTKLRILNLTNNKINDVSIKILEKLLTLDECSLKNNEILHKIADDAVGNKEIIIKLIRLKKDRQIASKKKILPIEEKSNNINTRPLIITEGKTDWKHLKKALDRFQSDEFNLYKNLNIKFEEYQDIGVGESTIDSWLKSTVKQKQDRVHLFMFDRDTHKYVEEYGKRDFIRVLDKDYLNRLKEKLEKYYGDKSSVKYKDIVNHLDDDLYEQVDEDIKNILTGEEYKEWNKLSHNQVYALCIPEIKDSDSPRTLDKICIEFYYKEKDLKTTKDGKRLFFADEFEFNKNNNGDNSKRFISKCGKFKTISAKAKNGATTELTLVSTPIYSIDDEQCKNNLLLSKNDFTKYIENDIEGFDNFDIENFKLIFDVIEKIVND